MSDFISTPMEHLDLISNLRSKSVMSAPRLDHVSDQLIRELNVLSSIQGVVDCQDIQGGSASVCWHPLFDQMTLVRQLALAGNYDAFAENVRAMRWDMTGAPVSIALRLKAFYWDLAGFLNPFHASHSLIDAYICELQRSEDIFYQDEKALSRHEAFQPSRSCAFSSLKEDKQRDIVLSQALNLGLWDASIYIKSL